MTKQSNDNTDNFSTSTLKIDDLGENDSKEMNAATNENDTTKSNIENDNIRNKDENTQNRVQYLSDDGNFVKMHGRIDLNNDSKQENNSMHKSNSKQEIVENWNDRRNGKILNSNDEMNNSLHDDIEAEIENNDSSSNLSEIQKISENNDSDTESYDATIDFGNQKQENFDKDSLIIEQNISEGISYMEEAMPSYLKYQNQDVTSEEWKSHSKHIFIMSKAGKPIFTRYGSETDLSTLMGLFTMYVNVIQQDDSDEIQHFEYNNFKLVFKVKNEFVLLAMCNTHFSKDEEITLSSNSAKSIETNKELDIQLGALYSQIEFFVTSHLQKKLREQESFDVRKVLGGVDSKILHNLISSMSRSLLYSWQSYRTLRMNKHLRAHTRDHMIKKRPSDLCYAILISHGQVIQILRKKNWTLYPEDLYLLMNFVKCTNSLKSAVSWIPVCLPKIKDSAFLFAYINYLDIEADLCLMYICNNSDNFPQCVAASEKFVSGMKRDGLYEKLLNACKIPRFSTIDLELFPHLRHFVYFNPSSNQVVDTRYILPYNRKEQQKRLIREYKAIREKMTSESSTSHPVYFQISDYESILAYQGPHYELYGAFSLLVSKQQAIIYCESIKKFIKKYEDTLFLVVHTF